MWPRSISRTKTSQHRLAQNVHLKEMCGPLNPKTVLNIGAVPDSPDKEGGRYRDYFPASDFKAMDQRPFDHPDYFEADLMQPMTHLGTFDLVILMSVVEHIDRPWIAAPNIVDLIEPGGHLYVAMPWIYPTHEGSDFGDHWRARPSGVKILFEQLDVVKEAYLPNPLILIRDRARYWRGKDACATGSAILFRKPE